MFRRAAPPCPVCGAADSVWITRHLDFSRVGIYHCGSCTVLWSHPLPSQAQLAAYYEAGRYEIPPDTAPSAVEAEKSAVAAGQVQFLEQTLSSVRGLATLEIGCSAGFLLERLQRQGARCTGVELDQNAVAYARDIRGLDVRHGDFVEATSGGRRYDLVVLSHVFEHLPDPRDALRRLSRSLNPGGSIFLELPHEDLSVFRLKAARDYRYCSSHLYFYGARALTHLATRCDLSIRSLAFCGPALTAFYREKPHARGVRRLLNTRAGRPVKEWLRPVYRRVAAAAPSPPRPAWDWNEAHAEEADAKNMRVLLTPR
jgi:SAM-dependent methyltransferase